MTQAGRVDLSSLQRHCKSFARTGPRLYHVRRSRADYPRPRASGDTAAQGPIGTENSIPEEMDHGKIAVRVPVMNEVQFPFPSEPRKPLKLRSLYVVLLIEEDVCVERGGACDYLNHEEVEWQ